MGFITPHTARGNYYLETNKVAPFGRKSKILEYIKKISKHLWYTDDVEHCDDNDDGLLLYYCKETNNINSKMW